MYLNEVSQRHKLIEETFNVVCSHYRVEWQDVYRQSHPGKQMNYGVKVVEVKACLFFILSDILGTSYEVVKELINLSQYHARKAKSHPKSFHRDRKVLEMINSIKRNTGL